MLLLFIDHEYGNRDFRKLEKRLFFHPNSLLDPNSLYNHSNNDSIKNMTLSRRNAIYRLNPP